jgi:hypothetical protein
MINFDEILSELEYRISEGVIDLTKQSHINELTKILKEHKVPNAVDIANKAKVYFSYLHEAEVKKPSNAKFSVGGKWYTSDPNSGGKYVGRVTQGKWIPATANQTTKPTKKLPTAKSKIAPPITKSTDAKSSAKNPKKATVGIKTTIKPTDAEKKKQKSSNIKSKKVTEYTPTENQIKTFKGQKKVLLDVIENGFLANVEKITKGVGAFEPSEEQLKSLVDITKKQLVNPNFKLKLPNYKIEDEDIDIALGVVKMRMGSNYKKWEQQVMKSGAVDPFLTTGENGKKRFREIVKKYLETGGRSAITGKFVPFNRMQLDHHIPYSSASAAVLDKKKKGIKTTLEEEKSKLDSAPNWDLMETELNQFKNSLVGNDLIEKAAKRLNMNPDEKELKKIQQQLQSIQKQQLFTNLVQSFENGDYSGFNETTITELNGEDAGMLAKAWNYWHPNPKTLEFKDNLKNDPNYITKLKKAGINSDEPHPNFIYRYQAQVGGSRTRGIVKPPSELKKSIFKAMYKEGVISSKKDSMKTDSALAKAILSIKNKSKDLISREKELKQKIKQSRKNK